MGAPRQNRVPIMLSDEELAAIDDCRFDERISTRAAAIRMLIREGLNRRTKPVPRDDYHYDRDGFCDNPGRGY